MTPVDLVQQRVQPLQLVNDEAHDVADLLNGLGGGAPPPHGQFVGGALQPTLVHLPGLQPDDDVAPVAGDVVRRFQGVVGRAEHLGVVVVLQTEQLGHACPACPRRSRRQPR